MYSIRHNIFHVKYNNIFIQNSNIHSFATHQKDNFHQPNVRLTSFIKFIEYCWREGLESITHLLTLSCFKKLCRKYLYEKW